MKISVLIPNYNHGKYIRDNFEGLLAQTHQDWEAIVVDDCSTDNSAEIIKEYATRDQRIKPVFLAKNGGCIAAVNTALENAAGEFIYGSAADDFICNPKFFEYAVNAFSRGNAAIFFGITLIVDAETMKPTSQMGFAPYSGNIEPENAMNDFLNMTLFVPGSSAIWNKKLFNECGGFHADLGPQCDYFINHALPAIGGVTFCSEVMATFRFNQQSFGNSAQNNDYFKCHALVEKRMRELPLTYSVSNDLYMNWRYKIIVQKAVNNESLEQAYKIFDEYTGIRTPTELIQRSYKYIDNNKIVKTNKKLKRYIKKTVVYLFFSLPAPMQKTISSNRFVLKTIHMLKLI